MSDTRAYSHVRSTVTGWMPEGCSTVAGALLAPADLAVLIGRAMISPDVSTQTKAFLVFAGLYASAGMDLVPEATLGPLGYADDSIIVLEALHRLLNQTEARVIDELWPGEIETLRKIQGWVAGAREGVQKYVLRPLARWLRRTIGAAVLGKEA